MIVLWILVLWATSATLAIVCWMLYMLVWVWPRRNRYATTAACREDFHRDALYHVLSRWLYVEVFPVLFVMHLWHRYTVFLLHQQSLQRLKQMGWQVETIQHADGTLEVHCQAHGPIALETLEQAQAIVEEGLKQL